MSCSCQHVAWMSRWATCMPLMTCCGVPWSENILKKTRLLWNLMILRSCGCWNFRILQDTLSILSIPPKRMILPFTFLFHLRSAYVGLSHYSLFQFLWVCGWYGRMKVTTTPQRSEITKSCFLNQLSDFHLLLDFMELHDSHQLSGTVGTCRKVSCILSRSTPVVSEETIKLLHLRWLT